MRKPAASIAAVLLGAGLLVMGTDYATFATTGHSLILGHLNRADATTTLATPGGPALRLRSGDAGAPALAVSNKAKVARLNADLLDGKSAAKLGSHAVTYSGGRRGDVIPGFQAWDLPVSPGAYQVSFKAAVIPDTGSAQSPVQVICGVIDLSTIGQRTHIYTADLATYIADFPAIMSGAEAIRVRPQQQPALVCTTAGNSPGTDFQLFNPVTASFTRINSRMVRPAQAVPAPTAKRIGTLLGR